MSATLVAGPTPWSGGQAAAHSLAGGISVSGDFRGDGQSQIATLYDLDDDFGLRIDVLARDRFVDRLSEKFTRTQWFGAGPGTFDVGRMKVAASDVDFDRKTDLVVLYDDGGTSVRLLVFRSTGTGFAFMGNQGWWRSDGYAWARNRAILAGNFSGAGRNGLLLVYQYDNFQMRIHYLESDGSKFLYNGDAGVYDSGPGQYDTARAKFAVGRFTRTGGPDQIAALYQYPNVRVRTHVFDPSPLGLVPVNGWAGVADTGEGQYDLARARVVAADVDGDGRTDLASLYGYFDGSQSVHLLRGADNLALRSTASIAPIDTALAGDVTSIVAGDWDADGKSDLAMIGAFDDGSTHAAMLRSQGDRLGFAADAWVSPASEARQLACVQCWPLRGTVLGNGWAGRRPLVVKIDNAPEARPQKGLNQADMVWELLAEGNVTRYAAMFQSQDPGVVGPVRSARFSDRYTTPMVRGALAYSGAGTLITDLIRADAEEGRYLDLDANLRGPTYYFDLSRRSPHNTFSTGALLRSTVAGISSAAVSVPRWGFLTRPDGLATSGGLRRSISATELVIPYRSDRTRVMYRYDAASRTYARWQNSNGVPVRTVDATAGDPVAARNVVVIQTDLFDSGLRDSVGAAVLDMRLTGTGPASIFRDGRRQDGTWQRNTVFDAFKFVNPNGETILLAPGQSWIHVIPIDWTVTST